jgi:hypothetical protein
MSDLSPTVDPELTQRLGQIVIHWAILESWISALLATVVQADPGSMLLITNNMSTATQTRWIRGLLARRQSDPLKDERLTALLNRSEELRGRRNELVHGLWDTTGCEPQTAKVQTINLERSQPIRLRTIGTKELDELMAQIDDWIADYIKLGRELAFPRKRGLLNSFFDD